MAEEIHNPERMIPLSILGTVGIGLVSALVYSIAIFFSMSDLAGISSTTTGVPILALYQQATRSVAGAIILQVLVVLTGIGCLTACRKSYSTPSKLLECVRLMYLIDRHMASTSGLVFCSGPRHAWIQVLVSCTS